MKGQANYLSAVMRGWLAVTAARTIQAHGKLIL